jgi:DnaJ-class molecular chaperone
MSRTLYDEIGLDPWASAEEIEERCLWLGKELLGKQDTQSRERFAAIEKAYETLKDPQKRNCYDEEFLSIEQLFKARGDRFEARTWRGAARFDTKSMEISRQIFDLDGTPGAARIVAKLQRELQDRELEVRREFEERQARKDAKASPGS